MRRIGHQEPLDLVFILHADDDRHRSSVARNDDRPGFARFQKCAELGLYLCDRCDLHNCTSSPPMNRRAFCFSPIAMIWTTRASSSMSYKTRKRLLGPKRISQVA